MLTLLRVSGPDRGMRAKADRPRERAGGPDRQGEDQGRGEGPEYCRAQASYFQFGIPGRYLHFTYN